MEIQGFARKKGIQRIMKEQDIIEQLLSHFY
jgi:hypothetical protein